METDWYSATFNATRHTLLVKKSSQHNRKPYQILQITQRPFRTDSFETIPETSKLQTSKHGQATIFILKIIWLQKSRHNGFSKFFSGDSSIKLLIGSESEPIIELSKNEKHLKKWPHSSQSTTIGKILFWKTFPQLTGPINTKTTLVAVKIAIE